MPAVANGVTGEIKKLYRIVLQKFYRLKICFYFQVGAISSDNSFGMCRVRRSPFHSNKVTYDLKVSI